ncbi:MAG: hypothetical protein UZ03_NOB001002210 [Nitrospira sp. OLB3]|nr:MAG: hypothetical protein UZ03_NOB001002210 [Nitrospira sp. OLB3]
MADRVRTYSGTRKPTPHQHHGKRNCVKILQRLSAYLDDELSGDVCNEIRAHLGDCPNCEVFLDSLRQTVRLCQHRPSLRSLHGIVPTCVERSSRRRLRPNRP